MKNIVVVAAIIVFEKKFLCVQRGSNKYHYISKKFEFPGGKIEENETEEYALKREIREELSMDIDIDDFFMTVNHQYPDFHLTMKVYKCSSLSSNLTLSEHINFKWLREDEMKGLDWAAADIPIVDKLIEQQK